MNISTKMIVSNSDITKNYKICRDRAESIGKIFILKNNEPDAVLFSIAEYERLSGLIEYADYLDVNDIAHILEFMPRDIELMPRDMMKRDYSMGLLRKDMDQIVAVDIIK